MSTEHCTSGALALLFPEVKFVNSFWKTVSILICTRQPSLSEEQICYQSLWRNRSGEVYGHYLLYVVNWTNVVGVGTHCGLDCLGIKSRWGWDFLCSSRLALGSTQPPVQWALGLFPGYKVAWVWLWPPTPT